MTAPPIDPSGADQRVRVVYCAVPDQATADRLGGLAVSRHVAACSSSWPIRSIYWWNGRVERTEEFALLLKTSPKKVGALFDLLAREHPYEVPDILELKAPRIHEPYVRWLFASIDPESYEPAPGRRVRRSTPAGSRRVRGAPSRRRTRAPRRRP